MFKRRHFSGVVFTAGRVIRAEIVVVIVVGLLSLVVGWHTSGEIAQAFVITGILILVASGAGTLAGRNDPHCVEHQYVRMAMHDFADQDRQDRPGGRLDVSQLIQGAILGGLTLGIALAISTVAGRQNLRRDAAGRRALRD